MEREMMWVSTDEQKFEHLRLVKNQDSVLADGMLIHLDSKKTCRVRYLIRCNTNWQIRKVEMHRLDDSDQSLVLYSDGNGRWMNDQDEAIPDLDGCKDIDIYYSPFTNTLAICRLGLNPGELAEINVAFITIPELTANVVRQQYTCLNKTPEGGLYHYKSLESGFTAELPVDSDKLLIEYPKFFRRVCDR